MFRKILIAAMLATAAGYCFAASKLPQVVTSEVFYEDERTVNTEEQSYDDMYQNDVYDDYYVEQPQPVAVPQPVMPMVIPAWPLAGSDADVTVACDSKACSKSQKSDNIRIVSKIGADLVVENNFNLGANGDGWSGGANMLHGNQIPVGFDDECAYGSEMPLLHREVLEDDGGNVLAMSRSGRRNCAKYASGYDAYLAKNGLTERTIMTDGGEDTLLVSGDTEISVDISGDAESATALQDQVRSWVVASGQTLREVLQSWCDKEGWDLVWATSREYPIQASAVFKGRFVDVASAVVRNFGRAIPVPYAKFYKGNRVLVVSTTEE
jgi:hypothetical protein